MINLSKYFEKFRRIDGGRGDKLNKIIESVSSITKIELKPEEIYVKDNFFVELKVSPIKRVEILMHQNDIIAELALKNIEIKNFR